MRIDPLAASQLYDSAQKATSPATEVEERGFADAIEQALQDMRSTVANGERAAMEAMAGKGDVQSVVEALAATEMALQTAVTVRDRVVEAYQEILRMPV
ncbi:MAG: flagellar hook-basal body complex protein FliE [Pseudomonadota bacterium]